MAHSMASFFGPYREYCVENPGVVWFNDAHRPLLAGLSVVTVDQVLIAALATRFNMVRLWALTGKVLVVDEVHSLEPYMLALLARVLSWCGFLGVPVVLLSATLPASMTRELTRAYLSGVEPGRDRDVAVPVYPGWVFTGADGRVQRPTAGAVTAMRGHGRRTARMEHVRYGQGERVRAIAGYARRAAEEGGCVAVICATVKAAQYTFDRLRTSLPEEMLTLLHARFPDRQRAAVEDEVIAAFGREATRENGQRPVSRIVVSTSLLEQSLDVDFDLVISDLAPIASLVQRLGRCHRHPRAGRPAWLGEPRLVVLDPAEGLPSQWCEMHPEYELLDTRQVLGEHGPLLRVPEDVDGLVQRVHSRDLPPVDPELAQAWAERHAMTAVHRSLARHVATPPPYLVRDLQGMTHPDVGDADVSTRLGMDTARVIPYIEDAEGKQWLEEGVPVPGTHLDRSKIARLVEYSIPCPQQWARGLEPVPRRWTHPLLREAKLLPRTGAGGLRVDPDLGLVKGQLNDQW